MVVFGVRVLLREALWKSCNLMWCFLWPCDVLMLDGWACMVFGCGCCKCRGGLGAEGCAAFISGFAASLCFAFGWGRCVDVVILLGVL